MRSLILKEVRENRALIFGFLVLAPVLSIALKWGLVGWEKTTPQQSVQFLIPGLLLLWVIAIGADLVAGDASSGRIAFVAALPVRPSVAWLAKALFLAGSAAAYLAFLLFLEAVVLALAGKEFVWMFTEFGARADYLWFVAAIGSATLFYSTLIDRGFAVALAALVTLAGIGLALFVIFDSGLFAIRSYSQVEPLALRAAIMLTLAFLLGSFLAFTRGRIHLGSRLRRVAFAAAAFVLVTVPPVADAAISLDRWMTIEPGDTNVILGLAAITPDGRWMLAAAERAGAGPLGVRSDHTSGFFAVNLEDGRVRNLGTHGRIWHYTRSFETPGHVLLFRTEIALNEKRMLLLFVDYDLEEGRVVSTRTAPLAFLSEPMSMEYGEFRCELARGSTPARIVYPDGRAVELPAGWRPLGGAASWGLGVHRSGRREFGVFVPETGEILPVAVYPTLLPETPTRAGIHIGSGGIHLVPLDGTETVAILATGEGSGHVVSNDRTRAIVFGADGPVLVDRRGALTRLEGVPRGAKVVGARWSPDSSSFLLVTTSGPYRGGPDSARLDPLPPFPYTANAAWYDGRRAIFQHALGRKLVLLDENGDYRQLLPVEAN